MKFTGLVIFSMATFGLGVAHTVAAASPSNVETVTVSVSYAGLNITTAQGAQILYDRMRTAAESACDVNSARKFGELRRVLESKRCYNELLNGLVIKADSYQLTRLHAS
jgi:UrcA family protein